MKCPFCSCNESEVIYITHINQEETAVRRRQCLRCDKRYTTDEIVRQEFIKNDQPAYSHKVS